MSAFNDPRLLRATLDAEAGPACRHCGYELKGLPLIAPCPECGTPRQSPEQKRRASLSRSQGLMRAGALAHFRFAAGFAGLSLVVALAPLAPALEMLTSVSAGSLLVTLAGVWLVSLLLLLVKRFAVGDAEDRSTTEAPAWLVVVTLSTQTLWLVAALLDSLALGPDWLTLAAVGGAALGAFPTMWCVGDVLEWGGDETTGRSVKWLLLTPIYIGFFAAIVGGVLYLFMPRVPGVLTLMGRLAVVIAVVYAYIRLIHALYGGVSIVLWARVHKHNEAGKIERLRERRERVEAEQAARIGASEARHIARRAKADRPVSVDDFRS